MHQQSKKKLERIIYGRPPKNKNKTKNKENIKNNTKEEEEDKADE